MDAEHGAILLLPLVGGRWVYRFSIHGGLPLPPLLSSPLRDFPPKISQLEYRIGEELVAARWIYVHDCTGTHRDEYFFTTDITMKPQHMVECYKQRWSIETTFQECREHLKLESTKSYSQQTVLRFTPCLFGLYTIVALLYLQLPRPVNMLRTVFWRGKSTVTFSDMIMCVRRALWEQWCFQTQAHAQEFSKLSPSFQETILSALVPAA